MSNQLKFVSFTPEYFAGINKDQGPLYNGTDMVLVFPEAQRITEFSADQGQGKTSNIQCLKMLLGSEEANNAINESADQVKAEITFIDEADGAQYTAKRTRSSFSVQRVADGQKSTINSPKQWLKNKIGNIGLNPMDLIAMKGKDQIAWLRSVQPFTEEQSKLEKDILQKHEEAYNKRTDVNRDVANLKKDVSATDYYTWDDENKVFHSNTTKAEHSKLVAETPIDDESVKARFALAEKNNNSYNAATIKVENHKKQSSTLQEEIALLEKQLADKKLALQSVEEVIENGQKWLDENKNYLAEYEAAKLVLSNAATLRQMEKDIAKSETNYQQYEDKLREQMLLNAKLDELASLHKQLIKESTPAIPGLEVIIGGLDTKEEGLYYKGRPIASACESELWECYFQLPHMRIVFLENISSLGSAAVEKINEFVANGGRVFCTKMDRTQQSLKVSFYEKIV